MLDKLLKKTGSKKAVNKRTPNPLEKHAEKIVFGVSGVLCLWLLWMFVIGSPNAVKIGGRKYGPGAVDKQIRSKAERLDAMINEAPEPVSSFADPSIAYGKKFNNPLENVPDFEIRMPSQGDTVFEEKRLYALPVIGGIEDTVASVIRGAAHVPVDEIAMDNPYDKAMTKLGDIDLVTVEGRFDVAALYRGFKQSFYQGRGLKTEWRDEELAVPVFAAARLERRQLIEDSGWGEWEVVERPKIDKFSKKLNIPESAEEVRYDIGMLKTQFQAFADQQNILQPDPYDFASANAVWLSPSFRAEYIALEERLKKEKIREEREKLLDQRTGRTRSGAGRDDGGYGEYDLGGGRDDGRTARRNPRGRTGTNVRTGRGDAGDYYGDMYGGDVRRGPQDKRPEDIIADNVQVLITEQTNLEDMREMLVFWAHDDTTVPGNTYQYRIRLGVFNPIAGKSWVSDQDMSRDNDVILWSDYSDVTEPVEIDPMVHFFPTEIARTREKGVRIQVSKYFLGNWRSENFDVRPGELIGKEVEFNPVSNTATPGGGDYGRGDYGRGDGREYEEAMMYASTNSGMPETIDYSTGAMLVDIVKTDKWTGIRSLTRTQVSDVLYTPDGITMVHLPVRLNNWTSAMKSQFEVIKEAAAEEVTLNQSRNKNSLRSKAASGYMGVRGRTDGRGEYYDEGGADRGRYDRY